MIIAGESTGAVSLKFEKEEWARFLDEGKAERIVGYSKGYFRINVTIKRIKDPYDTSVKIHKNNA